MINLFKKYFQNDKQISFFESSELPPQSLIDSINSSTHFTYTKKRKNNIYQFIIL